MCFGLCVYSLLNTNTTNIFKHSINREHLIITSILKKNPDTDEY